VNLELELWGLGMKWGLFTWVAARQQEEGRIPSFKLSNRVPKAHNRVL